MKKQHSLEYIKRLATKLKKERKLKHIEALNFVAKDHGYSNWTHCQRSLITPPPPIQGITVPSPQLPVSFTDWLKRHKKRDSPLGDLASDMLRDTIWPLYETVEEYKSYLYSKGAYSGAISALERAWKTYKAYLKRQTNAKNNKPAANKPLIKSTASRKIVHIANITPLHYSKRTVEKFKIGDPAWISWDGRKAIPVVITEIDDIYYSFKVERPLKKAGDLHYLRLDEVRSTPELACMNQVTN